MAGMAELADAADSKSAGTWYLGGSTPPPGTSNPSRKRAYGASRLQIAIRVFPAKRSHVGDWVYAPALFLTSS